jgi:hypothetical protein
MFTFATTHLYFMWKSHCITCEDETGSTLHYYMVVCQFLKYMCKGFIYI